AVAATGGLHGYTDYVFLNKSSYLNVGVTYLAQLHDAARVAIGTRGSGALADRLLTAVTVLPVAALAGLAAAFVRARRPDRALVQPAAFTLVGLASLVPRPTPTHPAAAAPLP